MARWLLALLMLAGGANAQEADLQLILDKNWDIVEESDAVLQTPVCRAFTRASNSAEPVELSLAYPKDGKILPMITLRTRLSAPLVAMKTSSRESEPLFLLQTSPEGVNTYYYAPVNFERLEQFIRAKNDLEVFFDPKGTPVPVKISLAGSSNTLGQVKKCLGTTVFPKEFFKLLNAEKKNLTPDLGDRTPNFLWKATQAAFDAYNNGKTIEAALAALRKPAAPLLKKEAGAKKTFDAAFASHARALNALNEAKAKVTELETNLANAKASLASLEQQKPGAEADLAEKKAIYLPLKEQMKPYEARVEQAVRNVKNTQAEIEKNEATIRRAERAIRSLEVERRDLNNAIPGWEREANELEREYDRAESNFNAYNPTWEKRKILEDDFSYRWAQRDLEEARRNRERAMHEARAAAQRVNQLRGELQRCQNQPGFPPNDPGRPGEPPRPNPPPNCSHIEAQLRQAQNEHQRAQQAVRSAESTISQLQWRLRNMEDDAERKVRNEHERLRSIRDNFGARLRDKRNQISNARGRINQIDDEIPALRSQIRRAENALPGLREKLAQYVAEQENAVRDRDNFSGQIGFSQAEANYRAAEARLAEIVKGIADRKKEIPALEKSLARAVKEVEPLAKTEARKKAELDKAQAELAAIQEQLKPFRAEEAKLLAELQRQSDAFELGRAAYQDLYKLLVESL